MRRNPFQRLISLSAYPSAVSKSSRADRTDKAPAPLQKPQSQPMQRGTESQCSPGSEGYCSSPSDEEPVGFDFSESPYPTTSSSISGGQDSERGGPLAPNSPELLCTLLSATFSYLLGIAELLSESITGIEDYRYFDPSLANEYDEAISQYDTEKDMTVFAVHALLKRAALPMETLLLAALILRRLKEDFYVQWSNLLDPQEERTKEIVILSSIVPTPHVPR